MTRSREKADPPSMDTVGGYTLQAVGVCWDAIRVPRCAGIRALELLGPRNGAVIEDPHAPALYWFVPTGTADSWDTAVPVCSAWLSTSLSHPRGAFRDPARTGGLAPPTARSSPTSTPSVLLSGTP
ncbi:hypothetical protein [Streptomyces sp. BBFR102]|uniref:hypothetical protein n=1 Tax=Streptomyces sp. BBFR102 TaxID=3448171 RepID=UPI003F533CC2